jgi:hypothetical protein
MARPYAAASATALTLLLAGTSIAQTYRDTSGSVVPGVVPLGGDGSGPLFTSSNPAKVSGTFSATLGGFQPTPAYSYQAVTTSSATYALPSGTTVVVYNTGSNPITFRLGGSSVSVTPGQADVVAAGGWMAFTVGSATYYAVVGNGSASTVVVSGGSGLPTGSGAGGGGGAGGTVAQGSPALAASAWPVSETIAGSIVSSGNPLPISFGSGVTLPSFSSPPTVNIGAAPTVSVTGAFWQSTQPVSLASLPALSAGPNTIGSVTQSGAWSTGRTWTLGSGADSVALGGALPAFASTPTFNLGVLNGAALDTSVQAVKSALGSPLQAGGSIGNTSFGALVTQWGGATLGAATGFGTAPSGNVQGVNADLFVGGAPAATGNPVPVSFGSGVSLPPGSNTIGGVTQASGPWSQNLTQVGGATLALGQQPKSAGVPVTLPSDVTGAIQVTPTITAGPYTAGYPIGGVLTFANALGAANSGVVESINVVAKASTQTAGMKLYLFTTNPSNGTYGDHAAPIWNSGDAAYLVGVYTIATADNGLGTMTVWNLDGVSKAVHASSTSLYGILVPSAATAAFASTSDVIVTLSTLKD